MWHGGSIIISWVLGFAVEEEESEDEDVLENEIGPGPVSTPVREGPVAIPNSVGKPVLVPRLTLPLSRSPAAISGKPYHMSFAYAMVASFAACL